MPTLEDQGLVQDRIKLHKRGVALPKGGGGAGNAKCGDMIGAECPGIRTTLNLTQALGNETRATAAVGKSQTKKKQGNSVTNSVVTVVGSE
jgi:hypothetical protein